MKRRYLRSGMIGSLVLHLTLALFLLISKVTFKDDTKIIDRDKFVVVELPPLTEDQKRKIVQSNLGQKVKEAPKNAYLGKENRVVKKEEVAKKTGLGAQAPKVKTPKISKAPKQLDKSTDQKLKKKVNPLSKLGIAMLPGAEVQKKQKDTPQWVNFQKDFNDVGEDYVKGVDQGAHTALNTKEYVFFGYFQRIRQQLDQAWRPILREHLVRFNRKGRTLASEMDYTTQTLVTLDEGGEVVRVQILSESGTRDLDSAAVKAFNKAGPFPNPPSGLMDGSGKIKIRWDFVLRT